jgi:hypothetical protein
MSIVQKDKLEKQKLHVIFLVPSSTSKCKFKVEGKGNVHPVNAIRTRKENRRVTSTLSLTSALDWGGRLTPLSCHLTTGKDTKGYPLYKIPRGTQCTRDWWAQSPVCMGAENLANAGIRYPNSTGRSEFLYQLGYPTVL